MSSLPERACAHCGTAFQPCRVTAHKYCSPRCRRRSTHDKPLTTPRRCPRCTVTKTLAEFSVGAAWCGTCASDKAKEYHRRRAAAAGRTVKDGPVLQGTTDRIRAMTRDELAAMLEARRPDGKRIRQWEVAEELGCSPTTLSTYLARHGLIKRSRGTRKNLKPGRKMRRLGPPPGTGATPPRTPAPDVATLPAPRSPG